MPLPSLLRRIRVSSPTPTFLRHAIHAATMSSSAASANLPRLPIFEAISRHDPTSTAVIHSLSGRTFRYGELLGDVRRVRDRFVEATGQQDLNGERIAFLVENSYDYVGESTPSSLMYHTHILTCARLKSPSSPHWPADPSLYPSRLRSQPQSCSMSWTTVRRHSSSLHPSFLQKQTKYFHPDWPWLPNAWSWESIRVVLSMRLYPWRVRMLGRQV